MKQRFKRLPLCIFVVILLFQTIAPCYAHDSAAEHNEELEAVLWGETYSKYRSDDIKEAIECIEAASYLTIDQYEGKGQDTSYQILKQAKMKGIPSFAAINYSYDLVDSTKKITPNTHRKCTHQGWDREYATKSENKFWKNRRKVLLGTLNTIFGFNKFSTVTGYDEKCNSLAGVIYYVHLLGDYAEADKYQKISILTDLAGHEGTDQNDMITALKGYVEILFKDQSKSTEYKSLMNEMNSIADKAGKLVNSTGGVNTDEEFAEYHQYAADLLDTLKQYIPDLLKRESFFKKVFYPDEG